jgi:hypothetical protein
MTCDLCGREKPDEVFHHIELSEKERAFLRSSGVERDRLSYCKGCWKALTSDREQGARIVQGLFRSAFTQMGGSNRHSDKMFELLMGKK